MTVGGYRVSFGSGNQHSGISGRKLYDLVSILKLTRFLHFKRFCGFCRLYFSVKKLRTYLAGIALLEC